MDIDDVVALFSAVFLILILALFVWIGFAADPSDGIGRGDIEYAPMVHPMPGGGFSVW